MTMPVSYVRVRGQSGRSGVRRQCPLMTHIGLQRQHFVVLHNAAFKDVLELASA